MAFEEDSVRDRAERAEAVNLTLRENLGRVKDKYREMMDSLGARERDNGTIEINFEKLAARLDPEYADQLKAVLANPLAIQFEAFVEQLKVEDWLHLRAIADKHFRVSGGGGEKPRLKVYSNPAQQPVEA